MSWFHHKPDPIDERERAIDAEIAALKERIDQLSRTTEPPKPKLRSTALPPGATAVEGRPPAEASARRDEPRRLPGTLETPEPPRAWDRFLEWLRGPPPNNPKLVNYLAAGSIQGLRPLRYEKRIARNRVLFLGGCLALAIYVICNLIFNR
jgi:hypothetical protein